MGQRQSWLWMFRMLGWPAGARQALGRHKVNVEGQSMSMPKVQWLAVLRPSNDTIDTIAVIAQFAFSISIQTTMNRREKKEKKKPTHTASVLAQTDQDSTRQTKVRASPRQSEWLWQTRCPANHCRAVATYLHCVHKQRKYLRRL